MVIRRATADDADALSDLAHRAKAHWGYPATWMREWDAQLTIIPGYLEMHDVWVSEEDGAIVGMCALEDRRDDIARKYLDGVDDLVRRFDAEAPN